MSLRFFTNTRVAELMSRLDNDVVGAQSAISNTLVSIITKTIQAAAVLGVMLPLEWRLTLISVARGMMRRTAGSPAGGGPAPIPPAR